MKRFLIACVLTFAAFVNISAQVCPPEVTFLKQLAPRVAEFEARGCIDLRIKQVGRDLWEISKYQEVNMPSNLVITGAGDSYLNTTYTYRGVYSGKNYYTKLGDPDPTIPSSIGNTIYWNINEWNIHSHWLSSEDVTYPWQVVTWDPDAGTEPAPTVTEVPAASAFPPNIFAKQAVKRASSY